MLLELSVENIAIIDQATVSLESGFTALTGETGAGKSLLVDAIDLALGGRADSTLVRSGAAKGSVSMLIDVSRSPGLLTACTELGIDVEDGQLAIHRDVSAEGRSTVRLNSRPVSVSTLRELGVRLVDLHGQHDHQALLVPERQIEFLDDWIGEPCRVLVAQVAESFHKCESLRRKLEAVRRGKRDREQRLDMLRFQVEEIAAFGLQVGEAEALQAKIDRLRHAERLITGVRQSIQSLSDEERSVTDTLGTCSHDLEALQGLDPTLVEHTGPIREALLLVKDAVSGLRAYVEGLDADPAALEATAERLDGLKRLFRKYGDTEEAVLSHFDSIQTELAELEDGDASEESLAEELETVERNLSLTAAELSQLRTVSAAQFAELVTGHVRELAMDKANFSVQILPKPIDAHGVDDVQFMFSANLGEPERPLAKIASGGEISRVMLAIKVAGAGRAGVPTLIFDEVDTGLSGRAAAVTARKLASLAEHYQVVVISHLPQIAARADTHFRIEKRVEGQRTVTQVVRLEGEERLREVARMLAGEDIGESALANARELVSGRA